MINKALFILFIAIFSVGVKVSGQEFQADTVKTSPELKFKYKALIIPTVLIGYGVVGIESHLLKRYNSEIKEEITENIDERMTIDDYSQYLPLSAVYGLNAFGIKGKNSFKNRTIILATSYLIMSSSVTGIKSIAKVERPDGSSRNSFPSGHTATAFMGAEFLWQEYRDVSVWYGITGYLVAAGTGVFRMYNDRHWLTDVTAGAGIGILSTKIAYWINPFITSKLFRNNNNKQAGVILYPYYNGGQVGLGLSLNL